MTIEGFRLSPQQKHTWLAGAPEHLRARLTARIEGNLDPEKLDAALREVIARHEILRTSYARTPGVAIPVQVIGETGGYGVHEGTRTPEIDLATGPVLHLVRDGDTLTLELPAVSGDARGLANLLAEIAQCYADDAPGETMQYADISEWLNELLEAEDSAAGIAFWRGQNHTAADLARLSLPAVKPASRAPFAPAELSVRLPGPASENTLLAAWFALLARLTGQPELTVGVRFDGRPYDELASAPGLFAKTLPIHAALDNDTPFNALASRLETASGEAAEWQVFFDWDQITGGRGHFALAFDYTELPEAITLPGVILTPTACTAAIDRADLRISITRKIDALEAVFIHDQNRFNNADIARLAEEYQTLLAGLLADPTQRIGAYNLVGADESRLLASFNGTTIPALGGRIHDYIEAHAQQTPAAPAVIFEGNMLTYGDLDARANQLARHLRGMGVGPGMRVALCLERSLEIVVAILGVLKAGGAYVPIDPAYPEERIAFMLADCGAEVCVSEEKFRAMLSGLRSPVSRLVFLDTQWAGIARGDSSPLEPGFRQAQPAAQGKPTPDDPAYVIYTSGSTGQPKGVLVSHRNLVHSTLVREVVYPEKLSAFLLLSSYSFDSSIVGIFWTLTQGGALVLARQGEEQDILRLGALIEAHGVSHLLAVPSLYGALIESVPAAQLAALRVAIVAGEACPPALTAAHHARLKGVALYNEYGPTEGTVWATVCRIDAPVTGTSVSIGRPIPNVQVRIVDEQLQPLPVGVPGELLIGGAGVTRGYLGREALTAERFIDAEKVKRGRGAEEHNPSSPSLLFSSSPLPLFSSSLLYRTGDLARWLPDGNIEFLGRVDHQVKIRGYRVELGEIESALAAHPEIREAVVVAREDDPGRKQLAAYILPHVNAPSTAMLREYLSARLPEYMVPAFFVALENFPLTPNGKVDRNALPKPDDGAGRRASAYVAPRNDKEAALAKVFCEVLGLEQVSVNDNFFELGGDSIISIRIVARANLAGISINPMQIFQRQTIAELAEVVGQARPVNAEQGAVSGELPLTPIQRWFFEADPPDPDHYNMSLLLGVRLHIGQVELDEAVNLVVAHHDALRLRFARGKNGWTQSHAPAGERAPVHWFDLSGKSPAERAAAIASECAALQTGLKLERGPTVQAAYFDLGESQPGRLFLTCHHLATDVVSLQAIMDDLHTAIQEISRGGTVTLPLKTTSFKYWAERQQAHARQEALATELGYWLSENRRAVQPLPLDHPAGRQQNTIGDTAALTLKLSEAETTALLQDVPKVYRTQINDALLTPLAQAVSEWTGQPQVLLDQEGHGREDLFDDVDLSRTTGWFTTLAPLVLELPRPEPVEGGGDPGADLKFIKEQLRQIPNRGIGYGMLRHLRDTETRGKLAALPQTEINFNYLGKIDSVLPADRMFSFAPENRGPEQAPRTPRRHLLEVVALIRDGRLEVEWTYSTKAHSPATVERLAAEYLRHLRALIAHCLTAGAGGFTPSDFPEAGLSQVELDALLKGLE